MGAYNSSKLGFYISNYHCSITKMPIVVKGILRPDDAELAIQHGVSAIAVSNHGGRQLDGVPATVI